MEFLVESALLTHGLVSISNQELLESWSLNLPCIAWMEQGNIRTGTMADFLLFRDQAPENIIRVSYDTLDDAAQAGCNGALTASGTMLAASRMGISVAVTCGMGGIGEIQGETLCPDLPALRDLPVALIAATPKDVVDIPGTLEWLRQQHVPVYGRYQASDSGFMAVGESVPLDGVWDGSRPQAPLLLLNPIPEAERLSIPHAVEMAKEAGRSAEARGEPYHPAANRMFDQLSNGQSSRLQLRQLVENALWAHCLTQRNNGIEDFPSLASANESV